VDIGIGVVWGNREERSYNKRKIYKKGCAEPISSLARALGRSLGSKDVALKHVRADFRQGHGGSGYLHSVEILVLVGRQGRIQVGHQRGNGYLITGGIGGLKQVTNGFVDKVSADTGDNQSLVLQPERWSGFSLTGLQQSSVRRAMVAALSHLVITEPATNVRHLDSLCPVRVIIGV
jgi:hypothetical protein